MPWTSWLLSSPQLGLQPQQPRSRRAAAALPRRQRWLPRQGAAGRLARAAAVAGPPRAVQTRMAGRMPLRQRQQWPLWRRQGLPPAARRQLATRCAAP
jgi:hypothetical protein